MAKVAMILWCASVITIGTPMYVAGVLAGIVAGTLREGFNDARKIQAWATKD